MKVGEEENRRVKRRKGEDKMGKGGEEKVRKEEEEK